MKIRLCDKCEHMHNFGYYCPCECHHVIDRIIVERKEKENENSRKI
jgi:hypothetical protein